MTTFDVQAVEIRAPFDETFSYIAEAGNLPDWTKAFQKVSEGRAVIQTPKGSVEIALTVNASRKHGTIDWVMTFSDGSIARAFSRVVAVAIDRCIYSFILTAPPVPLENLEGALEQQSRILGEELAALKAILGGKWV